MSSNRVAEGVSAYRPSKQTRESVGDAVAQVVATRLRQVTIDNLEDSNQVFGSKGSDGSTPIVITPRRTSKANATALVIGLLMAFVGLFLSQIPGIDVLIGHIVFSGFGLVTYWPIMLAFLAVGIYPLIVMKIPSGVYALMTKHGRYIGIYEAGRHFLPPWYKVAYMVTKQSTAYNAPVKDCPTADNVMVKVDLLLVFHVTNPEAFVYRLGAEKFGDLLASSAEEAIRGLVRSVAHDNAYELRGKGAGEMIGGLNDQFKPFGVVFSSATITNVVLPGELASALENQTVFEAKKREQEKHQEYELKVLNDREYLTRQELDRKNERLAAEESAKKERQLITKEAEEIEWLKRKRLAEIEAEHRATFSEREADGELRAAEKRAAALRVEGLAEAEAAEQLTRRRAFELAHEQIEVLRKLAENGRVVIAGNNGDNLIAQLLAAARTQDSLGLAALLRSGEDGSSQQPALD